MPPKKSKDQFEYTYSRNATIQIKNFEPQQVFHCEKVVSDNEIQQEQRDLIKKNVDLMINKDIQFLYDLKDGKVQLEVPEKIEENQMGHNPNHIYIPEKCKDLSIRFSRGKVLVSVTSVFSYLYPIDFPKDALAVYGDRGTLVHDTLEYNLVNNKALMPSEFDKERHDEIFAKTVSGSFKGKTWTKNLKGDDCNTKLFIEEHKKDFEFLNLEKEIKNYDHGFYGRYDFECMYIPLGKKAIGDFKSQKPSKDKIEKAFKQMAAYALNDSEIGCLVYVSLNPDNNKIKIEVTEEVEKYQKLFLEDLSKFKTAVGIG